jgi:hypothetical protein
MQQTPNLWQDVMTALSLKTPAQQARAKLYWHLFLLFLINVGLAMLGLVDQFHTIKLTDLIISGVSTGIMAMLDILREYYVATGQVAKVALVSAAKAEAQKRVPAAPALDANEQAILNAAQTVFPVTPPQPVIVDPNAANEAFQMQDSLPNLAALTVKPTASLPGAQFQTPGAVKPS